jgi:hypothetical protein
MRTFLISEAGFGKLDFRPISMAFRNCAGNCSTKDFISITSLFWGLEGKKNGPSNARFQSFGTRFQTPNSLQNNGYSLVNEIVLRLKDECVFQKFKMSELRLAARIDGILLFS